MKDPCNNCLVLPICSIECDNKTYYDYYNETKWERLWNKFLLSAIIIGFIELIVIIGFGIKELIQ
jgi:hypothetical protein